MKPRQDFVYSKACAFLAEQGICNLPVNPYAIIARNSWGIVTYRRLGALTDATGDIAPLLGRSRDGFTIYNGRNYCIAYNDAVASNCRILFTLMHEIGHIALGHFTAFSDYELYLYSRELEEEASLFASFVLAPSIVIRRCGLLTPALLHKACGLSVEAAAKRLYQYQLWQPTDEDAAVDMLFDAYSKANMPCRMRRAAANIVYEDDRISGKMKQPGIL